MLRQVMEESEKERHEVKKSGEREGKENCECKQQTKKSGKEESRGEKLPSVII